MVISIAAISSLSGRARPAQLLDLHVGEERDERMRSHANDCRHVKIDQRDPLVLGQPELIGIAGRVLQVSGALGLDHGRAHAAHS